MKSVTLTLAGLGALGLIGAAYAEPVKLTKEQMSSITAGASSVNQQCCSPGTFPGGNPSQAKGNSNNPSGK
jgi:hypothetical protein